MSEPQKLIIAISRIQVTDIEPNDFWINHHIKYNITFDMSTKSP